LSEAILVMARWAADWHPPATLTARDRP